jgi:hypothetical protein
VGSKERCMRGAFHCGHTRQLRTTGQASWMPSEAGSWRGNTHGC